VVQVSVSGIEDKTGITRTEDTKMGIARSFKRLVTICQTVKASGARTSC